MYCDIPEDLRQLVEPVVEDAGFELVDVAVSRGRRPWLVRVTIDTVEGDGRVPIERCADVSREIETHLDAADAIPASYRLEVSSPGLDRLLAREKDFAAACGSEVQVETRKPVGGRRRFRGRLLAFEGGVARLSASPWMGTCSESPSPRWRRPGSCTNSLARTLRPRRVHADMQRRMTECWV
jgi:ribosome maturation factor RimP